MNHFGDGGGGNDHTLLIRGDMLFIYTVDAPYNNRLHPSRADSRRRPWLLWFGYVVLSYIATKMYYVK